MGTTNANVELLIYVGGSIYSCLRQVRQHLGAFLQPLRGLSCRAGFGLVCLGDDHVDLLSPTASLSSLYEKGSQEVFFTEDAKDLPVLDLTLDHRVEPLNMTKCAIAPFLHPALLVAARSLSEANDAEMEDVLEEVRPVYVGMH